MKDWANGVQVSLALNYKILVQNNKNKVSLIKAVSLKW